MTELRGGLPPDFAEDSEQLVKDACEQWRRVRSETADAQTIGGVDIPTGASRVRIVDSMLVDQTHEWLRRLRGRVMELLEAARDQQAIRRSAPPDSTGEAQEGERPSRPEQATHARHSERTWERLLKVVAETVTIVASVTTVIVLAPEVWEELQEYAEDLVRIFADVRDALSREVPLLGLVVAIRQTDLALGGSPDQPPGQPERPGVTPPPGDLGPSSTHSPQQISDDFADQARAAGQSAADAGRPEIGPPGRSTRQGLERSRARAERQPTPGDKHQRIGRGRFLGGGR